MQNFNSLIEEEKSNLSSSEDEPEQIELFLSEEENKHKNRLERSRSYYHNWDEKKNSTVKIFARYYLKSKIRVFISSLSKNK